MRRNYSQPAGAQTYQRIYSGFRGVDFTNNPLNVDPSRSPYAENIIVDAAGVVHKRPGFYERSVRSTDSPHTLFFYTPPRALGDNNPVLVEHYSNYIVGTLQGIWESRANDHDSVFFQQKERLYFMDGKEFRVFYYDDSGTTPQWRWRTVREIATPTETQIAGYWLAEEYTEIDEQAQTGEPKFKYTWQFGEKGERNLLTGRRINTFCGDGIHKTFYLDCQHFAVYKVEMYRYVPDQGGTSTDETVTIKTGTNIRKRPSMSGDIIATTGSNTPTCVTTGKSGSWYQIIWNGQTAYVHQDRVSSHTQGVTTISTDDKGWEEITSGWSVEEDNAKNCTKIVFTSAPPVHPMGNGLPNIRITGAMTELTTDTVTVAAGDIAGDGTYTRYYNSDRRVVGNFSVKRGSSAIASSNFVVAVYSDHGASIKFNSGVISADDELVITYRRETFRDDSLINSCYKYGQFGEYNCDRWFYTGNPDYPNRDWYSEPSDPTIVLENSYTDIGNTAVEIAGYLNYQSDMLIVKRDNNGDNLFRRTASNDGDITIFPVKAYKGRGVTSDKAMANINGDCVYLTPEGVYQFVSSDLGTHYGTKEVSYTIRKKLLAEDLTEAQMCAFGNWLLLAFPSSGHCFVADTTQNTAPSPSGGYGWEWFYWTGCPFIDAIYNPLEERIYCYLTRDTDAEDAYKTGLADMSKNGAFWDKRYGESATAITAIWATPQDDLGSTSRYKFVQTRGAIVRLDTQSYMLELAVVVDGEDVPIIQENDIAREYVPSLNPDIPAINASYYVREFVLNSHIPRFKCIQFIFKNDTYNHDGMGLLSMEFQYRYGRYIK